MALIGNSVYTGNSVEVQGNTYIGSKWYTDALTQYYDWTAWTPVSATQTLNTNDCDYIQLGDEVFVNCNIVINSFTAPASATIALTGLPQIALTSTIYKSIRITSTDELGDNNIVQVSFSGSTMTITRMAGTFDTAETYNFKFQASYKVL